MTFSSPVVYGGSMANLAEIALRRLDGAYFDVLPDATAPGFEDRYLIALLGYRLSTDAEEAFEAASELSRTRFINALEAQIPGSMAASLRAKASHIRSASEFKRVLTQLAPKATELDFVTEEDLEKLFGRLVTQPLPFSEQDKLDLTNLADHFSIGELQSAARENNAVLAGLIPEYDWTRGMTVTDALRVAAVWSGGDPTLTVAPRFKLKRSQRRALALALDAVVAKSDYAFFDFARHRELWKRLFTAIHVQDYPVTALKAPVQLLFSGDLTSIDALIEYQIKNRDYDGLLIHLKTMPGLFARRLNELLRKMPERRGEILDDFTNVADRISTRVLVQLRNYFTGPDKSEAPNLPFAGKSRTARNGLIENRNGGDNADVVDAIDAGLNEKLKDKKIYIGAGGDKIGVMTSNRSSALGSRAIAQGSRIPVGGEDAKFLTLFTHWKNMDTDGYGGRVDLDLSGLFLSEDLQQSEHLAYYNTVSDHARYSGDITDAPDGAEEYIVVDVEHAKRRGFRYMAIVVNSYSGQKIGSIPECYAGIASSDSLSFKSFDAAAVETRFDLTAEGREVIPLILDLETMELVWVDMVFAGASNGANMAGSSSLGSVLRYIVNYQGLTVGDLVEKSGAVEVNDPTEADIVVDPRMSDQVAQLLV